MRTSNGECHSSFASGIPFLEIERADFSCFVQEFPADISTTPRNSACSGRCWLVLRLPLVPAIHKTSVGISYARHTSVLTRDTSPRECGERCVRATCGNPRYRSSSFLFFVRDADGRLRLWRHSARLVNGHGECSSERSPAIDDDRSGDNQYHRNRRWYADDHRWYVDNRCWYVDNRRWYVDDRRWYVDNRCWYVDGHAAAGLRCSSGGSAQGEFELGRQSSPRGRLLRLS